LLGTVLILIGVVVGYQTQKPKIYKEKKLTEQIVKSAGTKFVGQVHTIAGKVDAYKNDEFDESFFWLQTGSLILAEASRSDGISEGELFRRDNEKEYWVFTMYAGNICEGPHFIVIARPQKINAVKIDTCDRWEHVSQHLLFSNDSVEYKETPKGW